MILTRFADYVVCCQNNQVAERPGTEERGMRTPDRPGAATKRPIGPVQLVWRGLPLHPHERVAQLHKQPLRALSVNIRIGSIQVAEGVLQTVRSSFKHEPLMSIRGAVSDRDGKPYLEGHVESRHAIRELDPAEIVKRVVAGLDQFKNAVEASSMAWNLERRSRAQAEGAEASDECQEEVLIASIVRDVQEGVVRGIGLRYRSDPWPRRAFRL